MSKQLKIFKVPYLICKIQVMQGVYPLSITWYTSGTTLLHQHHLWQDCGR